MTEVAEPSRPYPSRLLVFGAVCVAALVAFVATGGFGFGLHHDELHYWPTSLRFAEEPLPSLELLRDYGELNTPVPFIIFGWVEALTGAGPRGARLTSLAFALATVAFVVLCSRGRPREAAAATVGLLSFPHFVLLSVMLYTDVMAATFAVGAVLAWRRSRWVAATVLFVLAISSRQYMLAFPVGLATIALFESVCFRSRGTVLTHIRDALRSGRFLSAGIGAVSILPWIALFGGLGPPSEIERQGIITAESPTILVQNALYFVACMGLYFVVPEMILFRRWSLPRIRSDTLPAALLGVLVAAAFALFPPMANVNYPIPDMGLLDRSVKLMIGWSPLVGEWPRMVVFAGFAWLACWRFLGHLARLLTDPKLSDERAMGCLFVVHAVMMVKAHIAWDKYLLALLAVLWFMLADREVDRGQEEVRQ